MIFSKKTKPNPPTKAQLRDNLHAKLGEVVADGFDAGLDVYDIVRGLTTRIEIIRAQWANSAPLGGRVP
jgi:hypothetical protein